MTNRTKIFLEPDYMSRNDPICQAGLFCKVVTSALFSCNIINFYDFCCGLPRSRVPGEGYFRNFWAGMCRWDTGTLNLYQSSFKWILLPYTRINSKNFPPPPPPHPKVAVFQKLLRSQTQSSQNKSDLIFFIFLSGNSRYGFLSID